jgi:glycine/D-amino acid oxidase-like deaminating enzyme
MMPSIPRRTLLKMFSVPFGTPLAAASPGPVVIAGAGIIGASIAYHLARRGAQVLILEKQRPAAGATQNSFAWLNAFKQPQSYYELNLLGVLGWRRLCLEIGNDLQVQWGGTVQWSRDGAPANGLKKSVEMYQRWGYPTHLINDEELRRLLPGISPGPLGSAAFSDLEGTVDPIHAVTVLLKKAQALGAKIEYPCEVTGLMLANGKVKELRTSRGPIEASVLVLAAGVDTPALAQMAGIRVPLKTSTGLLAHTAPHARLLDRIALAPGANIKQNPDGRIVTGTDFAASAITAPGREAGEKLLKNAQPFLAKLKDASLETVTLGYRVLPEDGLPIVGFTARSPNVYIASMHSGMTLAPIIGQCACAEILEGTAVELLAPFRLSRFG